MNDTVISVRCSTQTLAAITKHYENTGQLPRTRSSLINQVLEDFLQIILTNNLTEKVPTISIAHEYLTQKGLGNLSKMAKRKMIQGLRLEAQEEEGTSEPANTQTEENVQSEIEDAIGRFDSGQPFKSPHQRVRHKDRKEDTSR